MKKFLILTTVFLIPSFLFSQISPAAKAIVAKMTTAEKIKLVIGMNYPNANFKEKEIDTNYIIAALQQMQKEDAQSPEKVIGAAGRTHAISRLNIPTLTLSDGPAGVRINPTHKNDNKTYYATAWPVATLLASSWDVDLVKKVGAAFGNEVKEYGIDVLLAPALNIHRNPLGGRNFEYYSEDPVVAGNITAAIVSGIQSNGVGTSIKHFVANNQETNRTTVNEIISERALREIYLKGFEIAVKKSQPWTVMSSYNLVNGTYTSERQDLITNILRKEWGFKGFVMTDWDGGKNAVAQMKAGNDLLMPGHFEQAKAIAEALANGNLDEKVLTENCERIVNIVLKSPTYHHYQYSNQPDLKAHAQLSRMAATEGMILLKNNAVLPLQEKKIALFGNASYNTIAGGTGSGWVNKLYTVSLFEGLKNANYAVNEELKKTYTGYIAQEMKRLNVETGMFGDGKMIDEMKIDEQLAKQQAAVTNIAIITIGRNAGEGADRNVDNDFNLSSVEQNNIKIIADAFHAQNKKVIIVLNIGGVIETAGWKNNADAVLLTWQPGIEAGNAITDVLSGKVNPSGKLATSFPVSYTDVPSVKNFPGKETNPDFKPEHPWDGKPAEVIYEEGIYVGYRYYNTFNVKTSYEFGYGLSYTNFKYSNFNLSDVHDKWVRTVSVTITNTGKVAGKEIVQLYISAPNNIIDKPSEELKAFAKTKLLRPGESQIIRFYIHLDELTSFNTERSAWIADAGKYTVKIGASSLDIKQSASFNLPIEYVAEKVLHAFTPQVKINELKP